MKKVLRFLTLAALFVVPWGGYFNQVQAQQSLPYSYGFEDNDLSTDGWTTSNTSGLNALEFGISSDAASTGSYGFRFSSYDESGENTQYLISPELSAATGVVVQFYYKASVSYGTETFKVGYSTTDASPSSFTFGSEISTNSTSWTLSEEFNFPAGTKYVAIYYYADYQYRLYVDDINFTAPPACPKPTGLAATVTPGSGTIATLDWTAGDAETEWTIEYSTTADFSSGVSSTTATTNPTKGLTGLTPETQYYARVKAVCGVGDESAWSNVCTFTPSNAYSLTVNDGSTTNAYVPIYGSWVDDISKSQFIIPATALASIQWGTISELTFYSSNASVNWGSAQFEVYMMETNETTLSSLEDWNSMTKVMNAAQLQISGNQMVVTLDDPYRYSGGNLMIGILETTSGSYSSANFYGVSATGASMGGYGSSVSQRDFLPKMTISYTPGVAPSCVWPTGLAASGVGATTATLGWTAGDAETEWVVEYGTASDFAGATSQNVSATPTLNLTGLTAATTYYVRVKAVCGVGNESDWTTASFTTGLCEVADQCAISYELEDSYGDGWNGNAISVTDVATGTVLASWTIASGSSASGTLAVCDGRTIQFSYVTGSYPDETSYTVTDAFGNEIFSGSNAMSDAVSHTVNCTPPSCPRPTDLAVTATTTTTATLGWTENGSATQWQVSVDDGTPILVGTNPYTVTGLTAATDYTVKVRAYCAADDQSDWSSTVNFTTECEPVTDFPWSEDFESYSSGNFTATCWTNEHISGSGASIFSVYTSTNGSNSTHQLQLPDMSSGTQTKLVLPGMTLPNDRYSFSIDVYRNATGSSSTTEGVRVYASDNGEIEGATELGFLYRNYTQTDGGVVTAEAASGWYTYVFPIPFDGSCYIILRGESQWGSATYMDNFLVTACTAASTGLAYSELKSDHVDLSWTSEADHWDVSIGDDNHPIELTSEDVDIDGTTVTYRLDGLDPETPYTVKVRTNCGSDGVSLWSSEVSFTTLADCGSPEDVTVSNVGAHVADVAWTGNGDEFTVWYRIAASVDGTNEEFATSSIPTGWENKSGLLSDVMNGTALSSTTQWVFGTNNGVFDSHARINIYGSSRYGWLITPATGLPADAVLNFDLALTAYSGTLATAGTGGTDDRFVVLISTDDEATWTILREWNNSGSSYVYNDIATAGENVDIDLSAYEGESVRIAFYGESTSSNADNNLHIDNVAIGALVAAGSWEEKPIDAAPAQTTLEDLEPGTKYDVKVTPACDDARESDIVSFTTVALPTLSVNADKWYAISTPMHDAGHTDESVGNVGNLTAGTYDFLRYDESGSTWESQKSGAGHTGFTSMEPGRGYIYRRANDATLTFDGEPNRGTFSYAITVTPAAGDMAGWNLVGNPYSKSITRSSNTSLTDGAALATGGYTLNTNGTWTSFTNYTSIAAEQAFLVKATAAGTLNFSAPAGAKGASATEADADAHILFTVSNDEFTDVAYAMFADGEGLPKISHLNAEAPMLSIGTAEGDYAIAMMEESVERFPLHFNGQGRYTLRVDNHADLGYLHLIDRVAGRDIDLLAAPEYSFTGTGLADRFEVRLMPGMDENGSVSFVHIDGNRLVVDGEGELQVFDVMGRQLGSAQVGGTATFDRHSLGMTNAGVYVMRLGGNTQKIVVK